MAWLFFLVITLPCAHVAAEDSYLDQLEAESKKLTNRPIPAPEANSASTRVEKSGAGLKKQPTEGKSLIPSPDFKSNLAMVEFENELKNRFLGSFTFYKKLPQPSKEEVYHGYLNGNSIKDTRKIIMSRFLHSR
ncbi:MAG: hypothetical protein GY814_02495 [Gammaproteobacteria bacterium]|nr:hypothetical protein [Gammaproteobacteria bacterium]